MSVKIRLTRLGKKKQPTYRVVVMDSRKPRDGKYIEQLGIYDPRQDPSLIEIDNDRALHWLNTGAQPTERAQKLLEISGAWTQFRVAKGDIHTVGSEAPAAEAKPKAEAKAEPSVEETPAVEEAPAVESSADEDAAEETADDSQDDA
ncbi:MAG: 30S ribosomal protein S16 [Acidimicrobiia bacterium]